MVHILKFSKIYEQDVDSSYKYIRDKLGAPMAANSLIKELIEKLNKIKENPNIRPLVHDKYLASLGYRQISVKNFIIFYIIDNDNKYVNVIRFLYQKRNWINILKEKAVSELM